MNDFLQEPQNLFLTTTEMTDSPMISNSLHLDVVSMGSLAFDPLLWLLGLDLHYEDAAWLIVL